MKVRFFNILFLILLPLLSFANPIFDAEGECLITCYDTRKGGIQQSIDERLPLVYNNNASVETDRAFWIIKEESPGKFSFRNVETNHYIKFTPQNRTGKYVSMTASLDGDSVLFSIISKQKEEKTYYSIQSVVDTGHYFNKRSDSYNSFGTYKGSNGNDNNELFYFRNRNDLPRGETGNLFGYLNTFTINEKELIKSKDNSYYFSLPHIPEKNSITQTINFEPKNIAYSIKINNKEVINGQEFTFEDVNKIEGHKIDIFNENKIIATEKIIFTSLPIVQLYTEGNGLSTNFSKGKVRINEGSKTNSQTGELLYSEIRYRGATSLSKPKKSFAVKLKDESGNSIDRSFFGLRNDNYWILDAMAIDKSRMRNRVCTDLWNDFSSAPYYKAEEKNLINGTRGQYVEVFLDDEYWGLYCMTERIDRKQLKLKKYKEETENIRGVLYKSSGWSYSTMMGYMPGWGPDPNYRLPAFDNNSISWDGYEVKYPDLEDGEPITWEPLYASVDLAAKSSNSSFERSVNDYFDIPVWADYYLLIELIMATDNHGKNAYFSLYNQEEDSRMVITPWDLDGTFGRQWGGAEINAQQNFVEYTVEVEHGEHNLLRRLRENNVNGFSDLLKKRYDELRFTWFSENNLINRFQTYMDLFNQSGAANREVERWGGVNFNSEMIYLRNWIQSRVEFLNKQYGEPIIIPEPDPETDIENVDFILKIYPNPVKDILSIENIKVGTTILIYTELGHCIYSSEARNTFFEIDFSTYSSGRYFLKIGKEGKIIIKND